MSNVYTLGAERYDRWLTYDFKAWGEHRMWVTSTLGFNEVMSVEKARSLWKGLRRKGWAVVEATVNF